MISIQSTELFQISLVLPALVCVCMCIHVSTLKIATWLAGSGFMVMGLVSGLSLANHTDLESFRVLPDGARLVQPGWMPERRIPGGGRTGGVSF